MPHPSAPSLPERKPIAAPEYALAAVTAVLIVAGLDALTNSLPPKWDLLVYLDMARNGILGNADLKAPFAYSFAAPLLAGAVSRTLGLPAEDGILWVTRFGAAALLFAAFLLARRFTDSPWRALLPVLFTGSAVMLVKFPLLGPAAIDAAAFPVMVLAVLAFVARGPWACFWISAAGICFKEFLAIPLFLSVWEIFKRHRAAASRRSLGALAWALAVSAAVILIPRLGLPVGESYQEIDPLHNPRSLARLILNPLTLPRDFNILFGFAGFWLPFLLLQTRDRLRRVRRELQSLEGFALGFLFLNSLLVLYGGTNILIFWAYSVPLQIIALAAMTGPAGRDLRPVEWALALAFTALYNRLFWSVPLPDDGFDAYIDFYAGWSSRVNLATWARCLEMAGYFTALWLARRFMFRVKPAAGG